MAIDKNLVLYSNEHVDKPEVTGVKNGGPKSELSSAAGKKAGIEEHEREPVEDKTRGLPIDRGWAWVVLAGATFYLLLFGGIRKNFGIFFVEFQNRFQSSASVTSLLTTMQNIFLSVGSLLVMTVGRQFISNRACIIMGSFSLTTAFLITAYATDIRMLFLSCGVLEGLGTALIHPPVTATIGEYFSKRRGFANGLAFSGASTGGLVFAPIMSALFESYGYSGTLLIAAGMAFNICITGVLLRPMSWFEKHRAKPKVTKSNSFYSDTKTDKAEQEVLISNGSISSADRKKTDNIITQLVLNCDSERTSNGLVNKTLIQVQDDGHQKIVRSGSHDPYIPHGSRSLTGSPLLPRARASSFGNRRQRTISETATHSRPPITPVNSVVESLSHSKLALYSSNDCVCASVMDIPELQVTEVKEIEDTDDVPKVTCCSKLKASFDLSLFKNPVFPVFLLMAGMFAAACLLTPTFIAPHTKDLGLTIEQRGILMSIVAGCGLTSRLLCAAFADRKFVKLTTLLAMATLTMSVMAHMLRFFQGFWSFVVMAAFVGLSCDIYQAMYPVVLVEYLGLPRLKSCIGFTLLCHGFFVAGTVPLLGLLRDYTGNYLASYHLLGTLSLIASCLALSLPYVHERHQRKIRENADKEVEV